MKRIIAILALCTIWFVGCKEDAPIVNEPNTPDEPEVHAPIIKLSRNSVEVTAEGETINLSFTIENPVAGEKVEVSTEAEWVSNIIVGEEIMQFVVAQNTSEESRETLLTVEYEGADSCTITVTQSGIEPEPAPDPNKPLSLTYQSSSNIYRKGYEGLGVDRYYFGVSDEMIIQNMDGAYIPDTVNGRLFWCALYGTPATDPENPTLPLGTYTLKDDAKENGNLDSYYTYIVRNDGYDAPTNFVPTSATVTIEGEPGAYKITYDYTFEDGSQIVAIYEGDITLKVGTPLTAPTPWMEEDYDTEFIGIHANLIKGSIYTKDADVIGVQLYDCELDESNHQTGGILVSLELTAPKLTDIEPLIPDGVYNVSMNYEMFSTPVGDVINLGESMGGHTMMGTTARVMDEEGKYSYGAVLTGSVTVSSEGLTQTIAVDLMTGNGKHITGSYTGGVKINNYTYTPPLSDDPYSTLEGDLDMIADSNWSFTAQYYTSYYSGRSDVSFIRFRGFNIPNINDFFSYPADGFYGFRFDLIVENDGNITLPAGTYRPDTTCERKPMTYEIGTRELGDGGTYLNGSYGYLGYNNWGTIDAEDVAPVLDGSLVITAYGNDEYDIQFTVVDDKGNKITFSHRATVKITKG